MNIIPRPLHYVIKEHAIKLGKSTKITGDFAGAVKFAKEFFASFEGGQGTSLKFVKDEYVAEEGYVISTDKAEESVTVSASTEAGAYYALMTIEQSAYKDGQLHCTDIQDKPRYKHRGFMLDCARHFWTVEKIKEILEIMSRLKMNVFHWHLTDDQGWRAEIKKYPLLTQKGSVRKSTPLSLKGYLRGKEPRDNTPYGEGCFYTQEQMRDIVAFAKERHIEIIPEIDMPGHMVAAIACYPHLSCRGEETEVSVRWGVMDNILCCGKEEVYSFAKDIIDELCEIFPGKYFHIGGDEVPKARWQKCPLCQAKIKEQNLKDVNALQGYFNNVIAEYLKSKGKAMIGWNEILDAHDIMDKGIIAQWWTRRKGDKNEFAWMEKGGKIVISMVNYVYMDHPYNVRPLSKTYSLTAEKLGVMNENNVVGMEIPQWTEYIREVDKLDMLTMARLTAFSEVCWTPAEKRNYNDFEQRLEASREYLDGIKCRICPQAIYSGKTHPRLKFTCASKWNLWRVYPDYEFDEMKKMLVHKDSEK